MRVLVVGAGASLEEAKRVNAPEKYWPPTIANFAQKLWNGSGNSFFNYWLPDYLIANGIAPGGDPTSLFISLAEKTEGIINIERLFEYCWVNKGAQFVDDWENLIYHGVLNPLNFLLLMAFYENGAIKQLQAGNLVASALQDGDLVLNLNYDTIFEVAAAQQGLKLYYAPNKFAAPGIIVAKPHGSLNLLANDKTFWFAQPDCIGAVPSSGDNFRNWRAIIPPRFNKSYTQHPIARIIFREIESFRPSKMSFWGVGLTDSDTDLIEIYRGWLKSSSVVEVINPDKMVQEKAARLLNAEVQHFATIEDWLGLQA